MDGKKRPTRKAKELLERAKRGVVTHFQGIRSGKRKLDVVEHDDQIVQLAQGATEHEGEQSRSIGAGLTGAVGQHMIGQTHAGVQAQRSGDLAATGQTLKRKRRSEEVGLVQGSGRQQVTVDVHVPAGHAGTGPRS